MIFEREWKKQAFQTLSLARPNASIDKISKLVDKHFKKKFKDPAVEIYNSYEETIQQTQLSLIPDIIEKEDLTFLPSGVMFHRPGPGVERNLNAEVQENQLNMRKVLKDDMFRALDEEDYITAKAKDSGQQTVKKQANSGFGILNNPYSFIFSFNASSSVTAVGRSLTTISSQVYEGTLADTVLFHNIDEFFYFIQSVQGNKKDRIFFTDEIIDKVPSKEDTVNRLLRIFKRNVDVYNNPEMISIVEDVVNGLSKEDRIRVFYKRNMKDFLKNKHPRDIYRDLVIHMEGYNDPTEPPKIHLAKMLLFREIIIEFVTWVHIPFRYEDRARHEEREVTVLMDTDSNVNYYGKLKNEQFDSLFDGPVFMRDEDVDLIKNNILNTISFLASGSNRVVIDKNLDITRSLEDKRDRIKMKNEYYFPMLVITSAKKSYYASVARKEAKVYKDLQLDVKGVSFFKSSATPKTSEFIYDELLFKEILNTKNGKIDTIKIIRKIEKYKTDMLNDIKEGSLEYYKKAKIKTAEAYSRPMSIQQYKAAWVWSQLVDEEDHIELPGHALLIYTKLNKIKDLAALEDYPEIYEKLLNIFKTNIAIGGGITQVYDEGKKRYIDKKVNGSGISAIAIPMHLEKMPEWLIPIIDTSKIIGNNMSLFKPIYTPLGCTALETSSALGKNKYYTSIIKI